MKLREILTEVPAMVNYPKMFIGQAEDDLATVRIDQLKTEHQEGNVRIASYGSFGALYLIVDDVAIGLMALHKNHNISDALSKKAWQVTNVYLLPEHRNKRYGLMLYHHVLFNRNEAFAAGAAMTPDSRRVYTSMWRDPKIDVFAYTFPTMRERQDNTPVRRELRIGPEGVSTGDDDVDHTAVFIAVAK